MTTPYLQIQGLRMEFGKVVAVHDVTLDIRQGEFLTFLGPSGSAKARPSTFSPASSSRRAATSCSTVAPCSTGRRTSATSAWSSSATPCSPT